MEALYRKYRPSTFSDVVGQEHIERTLKNALAQDKVSHAYLFCGPRGTGKTTMARILAKALLCEKGPTTEPDGTCPECQAIAQGTHPDVYELDAASRTGVENVREEIISRVNYAPTRGAWKIYIIDEVHMLTPAAFNALLKTLEEPPSHVVFILCTTDPQKVLATIQSRCQRFDFHRISTEAIVSRLGAVCMQEGVDFEGEALDLIAHRSGGGMRNALTSLEQLMAFGGGHVTLEGAQNLLGSLDDTDLSDIVEAIGKRDAAACFNWVARYVETGADLAQFVSDLSERVRNMYLLFMAGVEVEIPVAETARRAMVGQLPLFGPDRLARMLGVLGDLSRELRVSSNPRLSFEVALTRLVRPDSDLTVEALAERVEELERQVARLAGGGVAPIPNAPAPGGAHAPQTVQRAQAAVSTRFADSSRPASQPVARQAVQQAVEPASQDAANAPAPMRPAPAAAQPAAIPGVQPATAAALQPSEQPSDQPVSQPSVPQPSAQPSSQATGSSSTVSVDLANPAALQRFWRSVTSALRKANPARGVLFMNAKVSAQPNAQGIVLSFAADNEFAFKAAQKREVQELLAETIRQIAGSDVPFRLVLAGGAAAAEASRPAPALSHSAAAPSPDPRRSAVSAVAVPAANSATSIAQPASRPSVPAVSAMSAASGVSPASTGPKPVAQSASQPVSRPSFEPPEYDDDRVPLDVYEASAPVVDEEDFPPYGELQAKIRPATVPDQPVAAPVPIPAQSVQSTRTAAAAAPSASMASVSPAVSASPAASVAPAGKATDHSRPAASANAALADETQQIKDVLTNGFGAGVRFEELPD